jgi:hypothetical protein
MFSIYSQSIHAVHTHVVIITANKVSCAVSKFDPKIEDSEFLKHRRILVDKHFNRLGAFFSHQAANPRPVLRSRFSAFQPKHRRQEPE